MKNRKRRGLLKTIVLTMLLIAVMSGSASAKVSISSKRLTLTIGQTGRLALNGLTGAEQSIVWKVKRKAVADISQDGLVTAKSSGTTKIFAVVDGKKYRSKLTVTPYQLVTEIRLNKTLKSLEKGKHFKLKATVGPENAANKTVTWQSSNTSAAKVNSKGKVTAVGAGTAVITARANDGSNVTASCTVIVPFEAVKLNATQLTLKVGKKAKLKATEGYHYTWTSENKAVATVNKAGKVKAKGAGSTVITVKRVEDGQMVFCHVAVTDLQAQSGDQTQTENPEQTTAGQPSARAVQFLALLEKYAQRMKSDKAAGIRWVYGGACAHNWQEVQKQSKKGTVRLSCVQPTQWALRELGIIGSGDFKGVYGYSGLRNGDFRVVDKEQFSKYCIIMRVDSRPEQLIKEGKLLPGDICSYVGFQHTNVYAGNGLFYDSGRAAGANGAYVDGTYVFNTIEPIPKNDLIGSIARIVR